MLMGVKNQIKVSLLTIKYATMRAMLNKVTFLSNVIFMILNNATFLIQWVILFSLKENVGGYNIKMVILLWGFASSTYGISHFFFDKAFSLSDIINQGKLDSYLVQPKNVLIGVITSDVSTSAIGDMIYGFILLCVYGFTIKRFLLYTLFAISGAFIVTSISVIFSSLSFWFNKSDALADAENSAIIHLATYPDGIFKGLTKIILYTVIPVGFVNYIPVHMMTNFDLKITLATLCICAFFVFLAFEIFYLGLRRYSSTNLMISRI